MDQYFNQIIEGDCLDVIQEFDDNSIDSVVCDPPYGISFMDKSWDKELPFADVWKEVFRVMKPGAHLLSFGSPKTYHRLVCSIEDTGFEIRDCLMWIYGGGFPKNYDVGKAIEKKLEQYSDEDPNHGKWDGWGTSLKPAYEPILIARKPLIGTVVENVLSCGTGALNIDDSRIASNKNEEGGRFPANLILDEDAAEFLDQQSGMLKSGEIKVTHERKKKAACFGRFKYSNVSNYSADEGGASRFFYCARSSVKERGATNKHPTVKPLRLMEYLVKLCTPPGGVILDHFAGSGTTLLASHRLGFDWIGIEKEPEHVAIARQRIAAEPVQMTLCLESKEGMDHDRLP